MGESTNYPTIDATRLPRDGTNYLVGYHINTDGSTDLAVGTYALVPLLPGWELQQEDCTKCDGEGSVPCSCGCNDFEGGTTHHDLVCPSCHGAGGWPVLYRPCDVCEGEGTQLHIEGTHRVECLAPGCVDGLVRVDTP